MVLKEIQVPFCQLNLDFTFFVIQSNNKVTGVTDLKNRTLLANQVTVNDLIKT